MAVSIAGQQPLILWLSTLRASNHPPPWLSPSLVSHPPPLQFCYLEDPRVVPHRRFPYEYDMAAGAFSIEFLLRSTDPTQKKEKNMNNFTVPDSRTYAQGSNRPFGLSPPHSDFGSLWCFYCSLFLNPPLGMH